jgi:hypothetical protein
MGLLSVEEINLAEYILDYLDIKYSTIENKLQLNILLDRYLDENNDKEMCSLEEIHLLKGEIIDLSDENNSLQSMNDDRYSEINCLEDQILSLESTIEDLENKIYELESK